MEQIYIKKIIMSEGNVAIYENINNNNFRNKNPDYEESKIEKNYDITTYKEFEMKNCDILINSFSIELTEEEKESIKKKF